MIWDILLGGTTQPSKGQKRRTSDIAPPPIAPSAPVPESVSPPSPSIPQAPAPILNPSSEPETPPTA
jgi:hypothetical protein